MAKTKKTRPTLGTMRVTAAKKRARPTRQDTLLHNVSWLLRHISELEARVEVLESTGLPAAKRLAQLEDGDSE